MGFRSDVNRYVKLIDTKPGLILRGSRRIGLDEPSHAFLKRKVREFPRLIIEIGSGSGGHLIQQCTAAPDTLFVGFELRYKRVFRTAEKAEALGLANLLIIQHDASQFSELFSAGSIDGIFVLFPDPWAKKRWKKHRILSENFFRSAHTLLRDDGFIEYKTDHQEYFDETIRVVQSLGLFSVTKLYRDLHNQPLQSMNVESEFEKLFKSKGLPVFLMNLQKNRKIPAPGI